MGTVQARLLIVWRSVPLAVDQDSVQRRLLHTICPGLHLHN